jgi:hypothetical protein
MHCLYELVRFRKMTIEYEQEPSGKCPVQAEGKIDGLPFYFRSRGAHWSLSIANSENGDALDYKNCRYHREEYKGVNAFRDDEINDGHRFAAGWAEPDECREFIERAAALLLANVADMTSRPKVE